MYTRSVGLNWYARERTAFSHTATYRSYDHALILVEQGHTTLKFGILESKSRGKNNYCQNYQIGSNN